MVMSRAAGKGDEIEDKRGARDPTRLEPQVFFFVTRYYYTNEYLKISGYPPIEFFFTEAGKRTERA